MNLIFKTIHFLRGLCIHHFTAPGPKYMLPSSVGFNNHDATVKRSPAFSLGFRFPNPNERKDFTPSPILYNTNGVLRNGPAKLLGGIASYKLNGSIYI